MKIIIDKENEKYNKINKQLGNCYTIIEGEEKYFYEFKITDNEALVITDNLIYIEDVITEFRKKNSYITKFYNADHSFYKAYEEKFTYMLPIKCIQPSKFFIDEEQLKLIEENINCDSICLPVAIINDEYVLLDGHTRLYAMYKNDYKMVKVYLDEYNYYINDFIYLAKENNMFNITNLKVLSHEEYVTYWDCFVEDYFNM